MTQPSAAEAEPILSVVIPVYNERATIDRILAAVLAVDIDVEVIAVDDFSQDGTRSRLDELRRSEPRLRVLNHEVNQGKGAALRTGFAAARGRFVVVQDADLEYDPSDFPNLPAPLLEDRADVVFGSRFSTQQYHGGRFFAHSVANRFLTWFSNFCTRMQLTDMETCYKVFRREIIQSIPLEENRFGFEPEITAKLARYRRYGQPLRIVEVPVRYQRRTSLEGKKIGWDDGLRAIWCILKYNFGRARNNGQK
jgi:glycosyltransferase involved in cell wall biosynthesis